MGDDAMGNASVRAWRRRLADWNRLLLKSDPEAAARATSRFLGRGRLGRKGATGARIERAEERIGRRLSPEVASFYTASDGWAHCGAGPVESLLPVDELRRLVDTAQGRELIEAWTGERDAQPVCSDREYLDYESDAADARARYVYLERALVLGESGEGDFLLLIPEVPGLDTWELWDFSVNRPGATRFRSLSAWVESRVSGLRERASPGGPDRTIQRIRACRESGGEPDIGVAADLVLKLETAKGAGVDAFLVEVARTWIEPWARTSPDAPAAARGEIVRACAFGMLAARGSAELPELYRSYLESIAALGADPWDVHSEPVTGMILTYGLGSKGALAEMALLADHPDPRVREIFDIACRPSLEALGVLQGAGAGRAEQEPPAGG